MKLHKWQLLFIFIFPFILLGCNSNSQLAESDDILKVSVADNIEMGKMNTDYFAVFEDEESLEVFEDAIENAEKQEGIVDVSPPDFDLEVVYQDQSIEELHLWVGWENEISLLMKVEDTHTIYTIPQEITVKLIEILR